MVEFLYTETKTRKLNIEIFVSLFPSDVELKSARLSFIRRPNLR